MLILRTLQWGPQHGHGIGQAIRAQSDELLEVETGSLYPALHRLEKQGWLKSEWGVSEANQRAKYYRLTAAGQGAAVARAGPLVAARARHRPHHEPGAGARRSKPCGQTNAISTTKSAGTSRSASSNGSSEARIRKPRAAPR